MPTYRKLLAAIDLSDEADAVLQKAHEMAGLYGAELYLLHVIEPLGYAYGGDIPMDLSALQQQLEATAQAQLKALGDRFDLDSSLQILAVGRPHTEIHRVAQDLEIDLILVGSHGRRGIQLLLGSTANGVLHGAPCDVLAVRIH